MPKGALFTKFGRSHSLAAFSHSVAEGMAYARRVAGDAGLWARHTAWRARPFSLRFLHALRNSLPNLFCNLDPAVLTPAPRPPHSRRLLESLAPVRPGLDRAGILAL